MYTKSLLNVGDINAKENITCQMGTEFYIVKIDWAISQFSI